LDRAEGYPEVCGKGKLFTMAPPIERRYVDYQNTYGSFAFIDIGRYQSAEAAADALKAARSIVGACRDWVYEANGNQVGARVAPLDAKALGPDAVAVAIGLSSRGLGVANQYVVARAGADLVRVISGWSVGQAVPALPIARSVQQRLGA